MAAAHEHGERMTQAQRTAATRARLVRAAFDQLRINGYAQFRMATVARNAGVSQGGQLHHFPTKEGLALAAIEFAYASAERATGEALARHDQQPATPRDTLRAMIDDSMAFYFSSTFDVALDVVKGAAGNAPLRRQVAQWSRGYRGFAEQSWRLRLVAHGWSEKAALELLELSTALVRGFALRRLIQRDSGQFRELLERWLDIALAGAPPDVLQGARKGARRAVTASTAERRAGGRAGSSAR